MGKRIASAREIARELEEIVVCNCENRHSIEMNTGHTYECNITRQVLELQKLCFDSRKRNNQSEDNSNATK